MLRSGNVEIRAFGNYMTEKQSGWHLAKPGLTMFIVLSQSTNHISAPPTPSFSLACRPGTSSLAWTCFLASVTHPALTVGVCICARGCVRVCVCASVYSPSLRALYKATNDLCPDVHIPREKCFTQLKCIL